MIMSLMGSGLVLLGICFFYDITGHLLMSNIKESVEQIAGTGIYQVPVVMTIGLIGTGLAIKSALWPFHAWLPNAYGHSTVSSSAILSSIVSKGYLFLLIKIIYRVTGPGIVAESHITDAFLVLGIIGMITGSLDAIRQKNIRKMTAYSSVAQIGYIFMGLGMASDAGTEAALCHIFAHASAKALVFISVSGLVKVSGGSGDIKALEGAGYRNKLAGAGFVAGSLSMIGIPGFAGFVSKFMFAQASFGQSSYALPVLGALVISTVLNAVYFMRVVLLLYMPVGGEWSVPGVRRRMPGNSLQYTATVVCFMALNVSLGICTGPVTQAIRNGLEIFG